MPGSRPSAPFASGSTFAWIEEVSLLENDHTVVAWSDLPIRSLVDWERTENTHGPFPVVDDDRELGSDRLDPALLLAGLLAGGVIS
jgi:hypothetical protein